MVIFHSYVTVYQRVTYQNLKAAWKFPWCSSLNRDLPWFTHQKIHWPKNIQWLTSSQGPAAVYQAAQWLYRCRWSFWDSMVVSRRLHPCWRRRWALWACHPRRWVMTLACLDSFLQVLALWEFAGVLVIDFEWFWYIGVVCTHLHGCLLYYAEELCSNLGRWHSFFFAPALKYRASFHQSCSDIQPETNAKRPLPPVFWWVLIQYILL